MPNLLSIIQQSYFILIFLLGLGVVLVTAFLIIRYLKKDPYNIGKRKGKKLARLLIPSRTSKNSEKNSDYEQLKKQSQKVSEEIFETGFTYEKNYADRAIKISESEIEKLLLELKEDTASLNQQGEDKKISYEKQQLELKERIRQIETELQQARNKEAAATQDLGIRKKAPVYRLLGAASRLGNILSNSLKTLEKDLLWFGVVGVFLVLLVGDFYITFNIFRDLMPTLRLTDPIFLYIGSGIIALVFVVLLDFFLGYIEKMSAKYREKIGIIQIWSIGIIGILLFIVYLLIISASIFPSTLGARLVDAILRTLFLPLVIAAALFLQKIRKEYGFQFLLNPFRFLISSALYIFVVVLLPFEFIIRILQELSKNIKSKTPFEQIKERELLMLQNQNNESMKNFEQKESQIRKKLGYIENKIQQKIQTLRNTKLKYETYLTALRQGCTDAVYEEMYKKLDRY